MRGAEETVGGAVEAAGAECTDVSVTLPSDDPLRSGESLPRLESPDLPPISSKIMIKIRFNLMSFVEVDSG